MLRAEIRGSGDHATAQELCGTHPGSLPPSWVPTCLPVHPLPPHSREETAPSRRPAASCRRGSSSRRSPVCHHRRDRGGEGAALPGARPCSGALSRQWRAPRGPGGPGSDRPRPCHTWAGAGRPPSPPGARSPSAPGGRCGARGTLPVPEAEPEIRFAPPPAPFPRTAARGWVLDPNPQCETPGHPARSQRSSRPAGTGERRARHSREAGQGKAARSWKAAGQSEARPERIPGAESGSPRPAAGRRDQTRGPPGPALTGGPAFDLSCRNT